MSFNGGQPAGVLLRADASASIGLGHCLRLLALAEGMVRRGGSAVFVVGGQSQCIASQLESRGFVVIPFWGTTGSDEDLRFVHKVGAAVGAHTVCIDGYDFPEGYYRQLRSEFVTVAMDDLASQAFDVDLVINPNFAGEHLPYKTSHGTRLLCGADYILLRSEFTQWQLEKEEVDTVRGRVRHLLITFGGSDPTGGGARILRALAGMAPMSITVVLGAGFIEDSQFFPAVLSALADGHSVVLASQPSDMSNCIAWADAAISACGGTLWELAYFGIPVVGFSVVDNQDSIAASLKKQDRIAGGQRLDSLSDSDLSEILSEFMRDREKRAELLRRFAEVVDGLGVERVLDGMDECRIARSQGLISA